MKDLLLGRTLVLAVVFATVVAIGWVAWLREKR